VSLDMLTKPTREPTVLFVFHFMFVTSSVSLSSEQTQRFTFQQQVKFILYLFTDSKLVNTFVLKYNLLT